MAVPSSTPAAPRAASACPSEPARLRSSPQRGGLVIGRIVRSTDFERVLSAPTRARSPHFAVHHLQGAPSVPRRSSIPAFSTELSTGLVTDSPKAVDDRVWLGAVVPKRHARRAVTRTLIKRQIRAAAGRQALPGGLWVVRLRSPFGADFVSAASRRLHEAARDELDALLAEAVARPSRA
ncbi:MAG TPA: ribonuclease P protein component [Albitalea sp.]|uniref:ribonuclease P protein component n=1 Tax=Piscinibacter sp. TaxID=1903157 RepID=UPI002ED0EF3D